MRINAEIKEIPSSRLDMMSNNDVNSTTGQSILKSFTNPSYEYDESTRNNNHKVQYIQVVTTVYMYLAHPLVINIFRSKIL